MHSFFYVQIVAYRVFQQGMIELFDEHTFLYKLRKDEIVLFNTFRNGIISFEQEKVLPELRHGPAVYLVMQQL